eukprot:g13717.t1
MKFLSVASLEPKLVSSPAASLVQSGETQHMSPIFKVAVTLAALASASLRGVPTSSSATVRPSTVENCPANFKDCGPCRCVPEHTCDFCIGGPDVDNNETNVDPDTDIEPRPSSVVGCPETHVDCGNCQCVPSSTCSWCSDDHPHPPVNPPGSGTGNSSVPLCPKNFKDCGSCLCVPEAVCSSCGEHPVQPLPNPLPNVSMRPSEVPGCPETNKDCGQCSCASWQKPLLSDLQKVILRPTETRVRQRDGQVLLERRSAEGLLAQEVVGMEEPPQFLEDQAKGLSRLTPKIFEPSSSRWLAQQVDASAAAELNTATQTLRVVSYNVWFSEFRQEIRAKALFAILDDEDADVVCLQEVTPTFLAWLREELLKLIQSPHQDNRQEHFVQERYSLSDTVGTTLQGAQLAYGVVLLLKRTLHATAMELWRLPTRMGRSLLLAKLPMEELELWVATVHLESDSQDLRREQLRCIVEVLDGASHEVTLFRYEDLFDWTVFGVTFVALVCVDNLLLFGKYGGNMSFQKALCYSVFWLLCAGTFNGYVYWSRGREAAFDWGTGYLLEWMLSIDNLFVFRSIFLIFHTPSSHKRLGGKDPSLFALRPDQAEETSDLRSLLRVGSRTSEAQAALLGHLWCHRLSHGLLRSW